MVAKLISGKSIRGVLSYNEQKVKEHQAKLIRVSNFVRTMDNLSFKAKLDRFKSIMKKNPRTKTNAIHISLNFDPSEKHDQTTLSQIASDYMEKIGFGNQPYLVYQHFDAAHPHLHIATTNIQENGKRIIIHNLGKTKSEQARKEIEIAYNLVRAESNSQKKLKTIKPIPAEHITYGKTETKRAITNVVSAVIQSYKFTSLAELNAVLQNYGVKAERGHEGTQMYDRGGLVYSILNNKGQKVGVPIKASSIYEKPTLVNLERKFLKNKELRKHYRAGLKKAVDQVLHSNQNLNKNGFKTHLRKAKIEVLFRENKEGLTYGVTFIDHDRKVVFNGSSLGKGYSAHAIMQRFTPFKLPDAAYDKALKNKTTGSKGVTTEQGSKYQTENQQAHVVTNEITSMAYSVIESSEDDSVTPWQLRKTKKKKRRKKRNA